MRTLFALVAALAAPASAATVVSEDFGTGFGAFVKTQGSVSQISTGRAYQGCCGTFGSDVALDNPFVAFGGGNQPDLGQISTTFSTVAGRVYSLSFRYGALGGGTDNLYYQIITPGLIDEQGFSPTANPNLDTTFQTFSRTFVGTGFATTLNFGQNGAGGNGSGVDAILDDVTIEYATGSVPEPTQWALLVGGFAITGAGLRRSRRTVTLKEARS